MRRTVTDLKSSVGFGVSIAEQQGDWITASECFQEKIPGTTVPHEKRSKGNCWKSRPDKQIPRTASNCSLSSTRRWSTAGVVPKEAPSPLGLLKSKWSRRWERALAMVHEWKAAWSIKIPAVSEGREYCLGTQRLTLKFRQGVLALAGEREELAQCIRKSPQCRLLLPAAPLSNSKLFTPAFRLGPEHKG